MINLTNLSINLSNVTNLSKSIDLGKIINVFEIINLINNVLKETL